MGKRVKITVKEIETIRAGDVLWDTSIRGLGIRQQRAARGTKTFFLKYRDKLTGRQRLMTLGQYDDTLKGASVSAARTRAEEAWGEIAKGRDPAAVYQTEKAAARVTRQTEAKEEATALNKLVPLFMAQMRRRKRWKPRTSKEVGRIFKTYVLPEWGGKPIASIRRSMVAELIERIEDTGAVIQADRVLAWLRVLFAWQAARDDTFETPIVRGMAPIKSPGDHARDRVLSDDEIRSIWAACDKAKPSIFGQLVRFLFLTGQRRQDCSDMARAEVAGNLWVIPQARYKTKMKHGHAVPLTAKAVAILESLPRFKSLYFTTDGEVPFSGFSKAKRELDRLSGVTGWRLHDIRRTAKTLMQRAGVDAYHSERVLGHVIGGVEGVYDRHPYLEEKRVALGKLATMLASILSAKPAILPEHGNETAGAARLVVRERRRTKASPKEGFAQEWTEFQVVRGQKIIGRFDTPAQAFEAFPDAVLAGASRA